MTTVERLEKVEQELAAAKQINRWKLTAVVLAASLLCMVAKEGFFVTPANAESSDEFKTRCDIREIRGEINAINSRTPDQHREGGKMIFSDAPVSPSVAVMPRDNRIIRAQQFIVVDDQGRERAALGVTPAGSTLVLFSESDKTKAVLEVGKDGPALDMCDANGKLRALMAVTKNGTALGILDANGKPVWKAQ